MKDKYEVKGLNYTNCASQLEKEGIHYEEKRD